MVKNYLFETDLQEEPLLPSPNQLKYKILIKNKKIHKQANQMVTSQQTLPQAPLTPATIAKQRVAWPTKFNSNDCNQSNIILALGKHTSADDNVDQTSQFAVDDIDNEDYMDDDCNWPIISPSANLTVNSVKDSKIGSTLSSTDFALSVQKRLNKKQIANNIHKSQSMTDSSFNKINTGVINSATNNSNNKKGPNISEALIMNILEMRKK